MWLYLFIWWLFVCWLFMHFNHSFWKLSMTTYKATVCSWPPSMQACKIDCACWSIIFTQLDISKTDRLGGLFTTCNLTRAALYILKEKRYQISAVDEVLQCRLNTQEGLKSSESICYTKLRWQVATMWHLFKYACLCIIRDKNEAHNHRDLTNYTEI